MSLVRSTLSVMCAQPILKQVLFLILLLFVLLGASYGLMAAVASLPEERIKSHVAEAAAQGCFNADYPKYLNKSFRADLYTECIGIGMAVLSKPELSNLLEAPHFGPCLELKDSAKHDFLNTPGSYARYTHGSQIVLKPLYWLFPFDTVQLLTAMTTMFLLVGLAYSGIKNLGIIPGLALATSFFFVMNIHVFVLVTHAVQFWLVLIGGILALYYNNDKAPFYLFGLIGGADAVVSFLNMGSLSLGFPLFCFCLARWVKGDAAPVILGNALLAGIAWSIGFLLPWFARWGLVKCVLPPSTDLFGHTLELYPTTKFWMPFKALFNNLRKSVWWLWGGVFIALGLRYYRRRLKQPGETWIFILPACIPLVWMCLIPGQSGIKHSTFTQIICWPLLATCFFWLLALPRKTNYPTAVQGKESPLTVRSKDNG